MKIFLDGRKFSYMAGGLNRWGIRWANGTKPDIHTTNPSEIKFSDASGLVRFLFYYATNKSVILPQSKMFQRFWFNVKGVQKCNYSEAAQKDDFLRIAFSSNHVWFIHNGFTTECNQSSGGIDCRFWNAQNLASSADVCFKIGEMRIFTFNLLTVDKYMLKEYEVEDPVFELKNTTSGQKLSL